MGRAIRWYVAIVGAIFFIPIVLGLWITSYVEDGPYVGGTLKVAFSFAAIAALAIFIKDGYKAKRRAIDDPRRGERIEAMSELRIREAYEQAAQALSRQNRIFSEEIAKIAENQQAAREAQEATATVWERERIRVKGQLAGVEAQLAAIQATLSEVGRQNSITPADVAYRYAERDKVDADTGRVEADAAEVRAATQKLCTMLPTDLAKAVAETLNLDADTGQVEANTAKTKADTGQVKANTAKTKAAADERQAEVKASQKKGVPEAEASAGRARAEHDEAYWDEQRRSI